MQGTVMGDGIKRNRPRDRVEGGLPEAGKNFGFHFGGFWAERG